MSRILAQVSCGAPAAVATKIAIAQYGDRCVPVNCDPENLRAWCQRCHLRYDQQHHAETRQLTRRTAGGQLELLA